MSQLTHLEHAVLHAILRGDHPALEVLRDQLPGLAVLRRSATPTSFSTVLRPDPSRPAVPSPPPRAVLDDLYAEIPGLSGSASFALFVDDGRLARLEGSTFGGEPWPDDVAGFTLHLDDPVRDLTAFGPGYGDDGEDGP